MLDVFSTFRKFLLTNSHDRREFLCRILKFMVLELYNEVKTIKDG